jgi:hypothetical protein
VPNYGRAVGTNDFVGLTLRPAQPCRHGLGSAQRQGSEEFANPTREMPEIIAIGAQRPRAAALAPALDQSLGIERPWRDGAKTSRDDRGHRTPNLRFVGMGTLGCGFRKETCLPLVRATPCVHVVVLKGDELASLADRPVLELGQGAVVNALIAPNGRPRLRFP